MLTQVNGVASNEQQQPPAPSVREGFGFYECEVCFKRWTSAHADWDYWQMCDGCCTRTFPHKVVKCISLIYWNYFVLRVAGNTDMRSKQQTALEIKVRETIHRAQMENLALKCKCRHHTYSILCRQLDSAETKSN